MLRAIKIVSQTQQRLATLGEQASAGSPAGGFAFRGGEDGFDQSTAARETAGKVVTHFRAYLVDALGFLAALGGDDAAGSELLTGASVRIALCSMLRLVMLLL